MDGNSSHGFYENMLYKFSHDMMKALFLAGTMF